jgi:hypothetical protein
MAWINLTFADGDQVTVNTDRIAFYFDRAGGGVVHIDAEDHIVVNETAAEIREIISRAEYRPAQ